MALDFGNKVENGGIPPQGVLSANEFNELVAQVNQNEEDISQIGTPNSIESIEATESQASGGNNVVTITETNGTETTFNVKNGNDGANGVSLGDVEIADNLTTDDATKVLSAKQGKVLKDLIDSQTFPIVDNLEDGGHDSALSAEMGKTLKGLVDQCATAAVENTNPNYPSMLAVEGEDYTVLANKTGAWNGTTLTDLQGNYCVIVKMRAKLLSYKGRKSGYGAIWIYDSQPDSTDYTLHRIKTLSTRTTEGTISQSNMQYVLMDIGTNIDAFKCWFMTNEPEPINVVTEVNNLPIKVNATYIADENLYSLEHVKPGGTTTTFEFTMIAGCNYFVMWNDEALTFTNAANTWIEYDANDNVLESKNAFNYINQGSNFNFGDSAYLYGKVKLNPATTRLVVQVSSSADNIENIKARFFINSDGHLTRYLYPLTLDGHPIEQPDLQGKVIACFGDSITSFGSANADGGYPFFLQKRLDNGIANYGRGNATFADWSDTDTTFNAPNESNNHNNTISSQIRWMLADGIVPDIAILNGGINDIGKGNGYTWDIPSAVAAYPTTTAAVFQNPAMVICYAVSVLRNLNPNVKIYIATTCKTLTASRATAVTNFAQNLRDTAEAFGLEVIDFYRYAQQPYPATASDNPYYNDDTHPSQLGVDLMGRIVMGHLKNYVAP